ncbi:vitamin B12 dependent methionine synthase, activation domain [bacterium BMS3Bbin10]|nr:vitamin B12 dependent methionine synthase, activation domain [bacterium BMS3Bbin10]
MICAGDSHCESQEHSVAARLLSDGGFVFEPEAIELRAEQVLRMQGYKDPSRVHPEIPLIAEAMTALAAKTFEPAVHFRRVLLEGVRGDALILETGSRLHSKAFGKYISECEEVAVFVMTLGSALDEIERDLTSSGKLVEAVFLETAGWLGIERLTKQFSAFLGREVASDGLRPGRRMSPGYAFRVEGARCEWPLEDQKRIFDLFDRKKLAVTLLDSCAMSPKMSRSGLYGLLRETEPGRQSRSTANNNRQAPA